MSKKIILFLFLFSIFYFLFSLIKPYYLFLTKTLQISPLKTLLSIDSLKTYDNQVSILILGIAGQNHDGPNLSDSITVINFNLKTNKMFTVSITRDIWSDTLKDKINSAYAYGEAKEKGGGLKLAKAEIGAVIGIPIQYAAVTDFDEFTKLIDFLGGVEVEIEHSFVDKKFPLPGREDDLCNGDTEFKCRYETISFRKGKTLMNGTTALKFVRSRNAEGVEGSDFARIKRQQKVIDAVKNKLILNIQNLDLKYLQKMYEVFNKLIIRDITNQQISILAKKYFLSKNFTHKEVALSEDFFEVPDASLYYDKYVLIPKNATYDQIHSYIKKSLKDQR